MMHIPVQHLSVRVPWHDDGWNGKVCCKPRENGSCMFLPRINEAKDADIEDEKAGQWMHELAPDQLPPCVGEKVHFMSSNNIYKKVNHPYAKNGGNQEYYGHYQETTYCYPGYSFSVIPYNWMLKNPDDNTSEKAAYYQLPYEEEKEPKLNFKNAWVQQIDNQRLLLDTFIRPIQPGQSLVFIYAKNIPHLDTTSRILIGVGHISSIGELTEYAYGDELQSNFRSTLWERPVHHTIREDFKDGFLLPYQELFQVVEDEEQQLNFHEYIAYAPSFEEFSYGSEWVSNDSAIASLLILREKLKKFENLLPEKNYTPQLRWLDHELSRLWKMRGPFPGLGSVLAGLKVLEGNFIAWELDQLVRDDPQGPVVRNPWDYVEKLFSGDRTFITDDLAVRISDTQKLTWASYSSDEKEFLKLLSRMQVNNDQVRCVIDVREKEQKAYLQNPYLLYEHTRQDLIHFPIGVIDKALFGDQSVLEKFPLHTAIDAPLDQRRIRAYAVHILEQAAVDEGHTLLTGTQLITRLDDQPVEPLCDPSFRQVRAVTEYLQDEVTMHVLDEEEDIYYFKLKRFDLIKNKIRGFFKKRLRRQIDPPVVKHWRGLIDDRFDPIDRGKPVWYQERDERARLEKSKALEVLANNRVSILIGPAGTGKTTLLNTFCEQDFIAQGTLLRLAPTGKARVKMGSDAQTLAQFLVQAGRYNPETGRYHMNDTAGLKQYDTVIVDESSMITEEQLAALLDSLTGVSRLILVGDYRQLPPIEAGRPFVDIMAYMKQGGKGIVELKERFRQHSDESTAKEEPDRLDVRLSRWFSDDEIKKSEIDIFREINSYKGQDLGNIQFIEWHNVRHLEEILIGVVNQEIEGLLSRTEGKVLRNPQANFDSSLGSNYYLEESNWSGYNIASAREVENWQILSPTHPNGYGTKIINQKIQKAFRSKTKEKAIFPGKFQKRKMNKPVGDDGIVFGDKVINKRNIRWNKPWHNVYNPGKLPEEKLLKYIANGEIGLHIGKYGEWKYNSPRPLNISFSSQEGYAYVFKESDFKEDGDIQMDLAYSITVHKSQGSGFKVVLFILPNPCPILSRELFYTALTRQEDRILILHQGDFKDYRKYTTGEYSDTGRRLTDLMLEPQLKLIKKRFYDTKYIQVSEKGEFMISKSEVIIADKLYHNRIRYVYEAPISDDKGVTIHPDFTIEDADSGIMYYWEHLGLIPKDDYRSKWKRKQEWYTRNDILDYRDNPEADKQLIITRDKPDGGIDSSEIKEIIDELFL